jgi:hypothetical protein
MHVEVINGRGGACKEKCGVACKRVQVNAGRGGEREMCVGDMRIQQQNAEGSTQV